MLHYKIHIDNLRVNYNSFIDISQKTFLQRVGVPARYIKKGVKIFTLDEDPRNNISFVLQEHHPFQSQTQLTLSRVHRLFHR